MMSNSILSEIFVNKRREVDEIMRLKPLVEVQRLAALAGERPAFVRALRGAIGKPALIAEIKRYSPSKGELTPHLDPGTLAAIYAQNGAAAISVLTEGRYFGGSLADLRAAAEAAPVIPLLRKDFIFSPYQVYEAKAAGASAVLLIAAALDDVLLSSLNALAQTLGLAALVEVHSESEVERALRAGAVLVGINNRDLRTFSVDLETTLRLRPMIPATVTVVAESGIHNAEDVARLALAGVDAVLVGESLVTAPDPAVLTRVLAGLPSLEQVE